MNKQLIASFVGGLIIFIWQFFSWSILPTHKAEFGYTANQDSIMQTLNRYLSEDGGYFLPGVPPGTSQEEAQAMMEKNANKPWASISYHKSLNTNMTMNMVRGFVADLLAAFLLVWLLMRFESLTMQSAIIASIFVGLTSYLTVSYSNSVWFETPSIGHLIDAIVSWGLAGTWLGWYLRR
ncbi:MAG: hypothetical protein H6576_10830 [Lewinellaceae bacterium]|nr:hypothetical protein [Saprospiraceae bacterium]MCB9344184.1 hypothetical protein [Lewinellaceae bacterium]